MLELRWYNIGNEAFDHADNPLYLERLTDEELGLTAVRSIRQRDIALRTVVENEERRRYLDSIDRWLKKPMQTSESERIKCIEEYNEIIRKGFSDYSKYLIGSWYHLEKKAKMIASDLPDSLIKTRYENAFMLVDTLMHEKLEKMIIYGRAN